MNSTESKAYPLAIGALLVSMFSITIGAALAKQIFSLIGAQGMSALRLTFAALLLGFGWRIWQARIPRKNLIPILLYGLALGVMNLTFYLAIERVPLGVAIALEFTGPLAVSILSSRKWVDFFWAFLAGVGVFLILPLTAISAPLDPIGILFALTAGFMWAMYILLGRRAGRDVKSGYATTIGMIVAALIVIPFGAFSAGEKLFNFSIWPMAFAVALLSSAIPYSLEMWSLKYVPPKNFGILLSLEPAIGAVAGFLLLRESLAFVQLLAIACIVAASVGSSFSDRRKVKVVAEV